MNSFEFNRRLAKYKHSQKAVREIYEYYYPLIVRHINRRFCGQIDGRDIAHTFFERLFQLKTDKIKNPNAWVYTVSKNIALEIMRKEGRLNETIKNMIREDIVIIPDLSLELLKALLKIEQKIIYLHYWEKYRLNEIAEILKIKYGLVKYYHRTAKKKLKREFDFWL